MSRDTFRNSDYSGAKGMELDTQPGPGIYLRAANRWCCRCGLNVQPKGGRVIGGLFVGRECLLAKELRK